MERFADDAVLSQAREVARGLAQRGMGEVVVMYNLMSRFKLPQEAAATIAGEECRPFQPVLAIPEVQPKISQIPRSKSREALIALVQGSFLCLVGAGILVGEMHLLITMHSGGFVLLPTGLIIAGGARALWGLLNL